jgi:hypothetical protein
VYASLDLLHDIVAEHLDREEMRVLCEHHQRQIEDRISRHTGMPPSETTIAGFLTGFRTAAFGLTDDRSLTAETIYPHLGGIYLCALARQGQRDIEPVAGFFDRLAERLAQEPAYLDLTDDQHQRAQELVRDAFAESPDLPINAASLAGFVVGVLYAEPFLPERSVVPALALMGATWALLPRP